jgi:hypothetical protein
MNRLFKLQVLGPFVLFAAALGAELAARALEYAPSSEILWFLNLRVFGIFQRTHIVLSEFIAIDGFQFFALALPAFALACYGLVAKSRLPFMIATHMSVIYAVFLARTWRAGMPGISEASLVPVAMPSGVGPYMVTTIFAACVLSFAITHLLYWRRVRLGREA